MEFDLKYKEKAVQCDGLLENWATYKPKLDGVLEHHKKSAFETEWKSNVDDFFVLLQLFPSKQVGRNVTANLKNFEASVDKLVQFELVFMHTFFLLSTSTRCKFLRILFSFHSRCTLPQLKWLVNLEVIRKSLPVAARRKKLNTSV